MASKKSVTSEVIHLPNVRLSFARLYEAKSFRPGQDPRFEATFLLDPASKEHAAAIAQLKSEAARIAKEAGLDLKEIKLCMGRGDDRKYDGYAGMIYVAAHNKVRPTVVDRRRNPVQQGDHQAPYSGCYVNGSITLWTQNNEFGKRVNANLRAVQFVKDGQAFGVQPVDAEEEFEALEDDVPSGQKTGTDDIF